LDNTSTVDKASTVQRFFYYLSIVLVYATIAFIASMLMMGYEDRAGNLIWKPAEMNLSDKIGLVTFYIVQFPLGLLFGFFTGNYHNGLFAFLINPILIAWTLEKLVIKTKRRKTKQISLINYTIWTALILTIIIYIMTE
jgi:hypothetical protein